MLGKLNIHKSFFWWTNSNVYRMTQTGNTRLLGDCISIFIRRSIFFKWLSGIRFYVDNLWVVRILNK